MNKLGSTLADTLTDFFMRKLLSKFASFFLVLLFGFLVTSHSIADEDKANKYLHEGQFALKNNNALEAIDLLNSARTYAQDKKYYAIEFNAIIELLMLARSQGDDARETTLIQRLEVLSTQLSSPLHLLQCYRVLALYYQRELNYELARDYFSVAVDFARQHGDQNVLMRLLMEQGIVDTSLRDYPSAQLSFSESYKVSRIIGDNEFEIYSLVNLTQTFVDQKNESEARKSLAQVLLLVDSKRNKLNSEILFYRVALLQYNYFQALDQIPSLFKVIYQNAVKARSMAQRKRNIPIQIKSNILLAKLYSMQDRTSEFDELTNEAVQLSTQTNNIIGLFDALRLQGDFHKTRNNSLAQEKYFQALKTLDLMDMTLILRLDGDFHRKVSPIFEALIESVLSGPSQHAGSRKEKQLLELIALQRHYELRAFCLDNCEITHPVSFLEQLGNDAAFFANYLLGDKLILLFKHGSQIKIFTRIVDINQITEKVNLWNNSGKQSEFDKHAKYFYKLLVAPFDDVIKNKPLKKLLVLSDRQLSHIAYGALKENGKYLIDNFLVALTSFKNSKFSWSGNLLVMANQIKPDVDYRTVFQKNAKLYPLRQQLNNKILLIDTNEDRGYLTYLTAAILDYKLVVVGIKELQEQLKTTLNQPDSQETVDTLIWRGILQYQDIPENRKQKNLKIQLIQ